MVRIELPDEISIPAEKYINASGYASVSDCVRSLTRRWVDEQQIREKTSDPVTKSDILRDNTIRNLFPIWMRNFKENLSLLSTSKDFFEIEKIKKISEAKSALVIGAGPSIKKYNHLKMLANSDYRGMVIVCDRILIPVLEAGIVPDIVVSIDGDKEVADFYNTPILKQHAHEICAMLATSVDPAVVKAWPNPETMYFMNCHMDSMETPMSVSRAMWIMANKSVIQTGGNVGLTCWFIAQSIKKTPLAFIGVEFSHPCPCDIEEVESYQMYHNMHAGNMDKIIKCFRRDFNPFFKNEAITHYVWDTYYEVAKSWIEAVYKTSGVMTYNCTGGGIMHSFEGITQMHFQDWLQKFKI